MPLPPAPDHMYQFRNQTVTDFPGYSTQAKIEYSLNSLGYRGEEFIDKNPIIILGGSTSFGIGIPYSMTFGNLIQSKLDLPVYNFSWAAYPHTNHEQLEFLKQLLTVLDPRLVIWQINNLNRQRTDDRVDFHNEHKWIIDTYNDFSNQAKTILSTLPHRLIHWDNENYGIDFSHCLIYNKYHVDYALPEHQYTFGIKSNKLIALKILQDINERI